MQTLPLTAGAESYRRPSSLRPRPRSREGRRYPPCPPPSRPPRFALRGGRDGALRLTTGRYYTPAGRSIQATGIIPDTQISAWALEEDEEHEVPEIASEADLPGALENENGDHRAETDIASVEQPPAEWSEDEDYQLHRALEILRGTMESQQASLQ